MAYDMPRATESGFGFASVIAAFLLFGAWEPGRAAPT